MAEQEVDDEQEVDNDKYTVDNDKYKVANNEEVNDDDKEGGGQQ